MWCSDKDCLSTDAIHVDASARLQVIQVNVSIFGNEKNNVVLGAHLPNIKKKNKNIYIFIMSMWQTDNTFQKFNIRFVQINSTWFTENRVARL